MATIINLGREDAMNVRAAEADGPAAPADALAFHDEASNEAKASGIWSGSGTMPPDTSRNMLPAMAPATRGATG